MMLHFEGLNDIPHSVDHCRRASGMVSITHDGTNLLSHVILSITIKFLGVNYNYNTSESITFTLYFGSAKCICIIWVIKYYIHFSDGLYRLLETFANQTV